jgi:hypothetical protein
VLYLNEWRVAETIGDPAVCDWAHCVHANTAILRVRCPCPRERIHGGFGGAINTIDESPLLATMDAFRMIEANHFQIVATRDADWSA